MCICASGQWKVKFDEKQKKGHFTKLNGDMVKVPILFHHNYMAAMMFVVELKAQVKKTKHTNTHLNSKHLHTNLYTGAVANQGTLKPLEPDCSNIIISEG